MNYLRHQSARDKPYLVFNLIRNRKGGVVHALH
jgi:hypothetical protein